MITISMNPNLLSVSPVVGCRGLRPWRTPAVTPADTRQSYALFTDHARFGATERTPLVPRPRARRK